MFCACFPTDERGGLAAGPQAVDFGARMREVARVIEEVKRTAGMERRRHERGYGDLERAEQAADLADEKLSGLVTDLAAPKTVVIGLPIRGFEPPLSAIRR